MNPRQTILDAIVKIAPDVDPDTLPPDIDFREEAELDSMDFLDIVMELRKRYSVQVPEDDYGELASLDGCVAYLAPKLTGQELQLQNA